MTLMISSPPHLPQQLLQGHQYQFYLWPPALQHQAPSLQLQDLWLLHRAITSMISWALILSPQLPALLAVWLRHKHLITTSHRHQQAPLPLHHRSHKHRLNSSLLVLQATKPQHPITSLLFKRPRPLSSLLHPPLQDRALPPRTALPNLP